MALAGPPTRVLVPGLGAQARAYLPGLPPPWEPLQPPPLHVTSGSLLALRDWLLEELARRPAPWVVGGHSLGAALAVAAAACRPDAIAALVLIAPAGLPLHKPVRRSLTDFARQILRGDHRLDDVRRSAADVARAPRAAARLVLAARRLDLTRQMDVLRSTGIPVTVIGCATDTLVPEALCQRIALALNGRYRRVPTNAGHIWPIGRPALLAAELERLGGD
jgi:pimeloyl-ACP methyl ester carboxylesterase